MNDNFKDNKKVSKSLAYGDTVFKTSPSVTELLESKGEKKNNLRKAVRWSKHNRILKISKERNLCKPSEQEISSTPRTAPWIHKVPLISATFAFCRYAP